MHNRPPITVFNKQAISDWESELKTIPGEIKDAQAQKKPYSESLIRLQGSLDVVERRLAPLNARVGALKTQLKVVGDVSRQLQIQSLNNELSTLNIQRTPLLNDKVRLEDSMQTDRDNIMRLDARIKRLNERMAEANKLRTQAHQFLNQLFTSPQALFGEINTKLRLELMIYDKNNVRNQSIATRICLAELPGKIDFLLNHSADEKLEGQTTPATRSMQITFAKLCGLLWDTLDKLPAEEDKEVANIIYSALLTMHIARDGDLPDTMRVGEDCCSLYRTLKIFNPDLFDMTEAQLLQAEEHQYQSAMTNLNNNLRKIPQVSNELISFVTKGIKVAEFIDAKKMEPRKAHEAQPDVKLAIRILVATNALVLKPTDKQLQKEYQKEYKELANKVEGTPSWSKKLGGFMLAFLGAAIIAASIFALVASFGGSAPISILGIGFGVSALSQGLAIGAAVIGTATFGTGAGIFYKGLRRKESNQMMNFAKALSAIKTNPQPMVPATNVYPNLFAPNPSAQQGIELPPPAYSPPVNNVYVDANTTAPSAPLLSEDERAEGEQEVTTYIPNIRSVS